MSFEGKVIDLKYKNCEVAYGFKNWKSFIEFYETNHFRLCMDSEDNKHYFLANFKPKTNHKGELVFQRGGARIALCCMETSEALPVEEHEPLIICKVNVKELKEGCRIFYADQRVIGEDIENYLEFMNFAEINWGKKPDINLPKVRYPLSDAEKKQRVNAGKQRTDALNEKDERIKELEGRIEQLERDNVKLKEEAEEALSKGIKYIQKLRKLKEEKKEKKAPVLIFFDDEEEEKQFEI